jgi:hypothetical protein
MSLSIEQIQNLCDRFTVTDRRQHTVTCPHSLRQVTACHVIVYLLWVSDRSYVTETPATKTHLSSPSCAGNSSKASLPIPSCYSSNLFNVNQIKSVVPTSMYCLGSWAGTCGETRPMLRMTELSPGACKLNRRAGRDPYRNLVQPATWLY